MKYHIHHGKAGRYGELATKAWLDGHREIASVSEGVGTATLSVTLYNEAGKGFMKLGFTWEQAQAIVNAHLTERGYDQHETTLDTWDIRAYND